MYPECTIHSLLTEYQKWETFFYKLKDLSKLDKSTEEFIDPILTDINQGFVIYTTRFKFIFALMFFRLQKCHPASCITTVLSPKKPSKS